MTKPVSLSVHKNHLNKREYHKISDHMVGSCKAAIAGKGVCAYVMVAWNASGDTSVAFELGSPLNPIPHSLTAEFVRQEVGRRAHLPIYPEIVSED